MGVTSGLVLYSYDYFGAVNPIRWFASERLTSIIVLPSSTSTKSTAEPFRVFDVFRT